MFSVDSALKRRTPVNIDLPFDDWGDEATHGGCYHCDGTLARCDHQPEQGDHHQQLEQGVAIPPRQHGEAHSVSSLSQPPHHLSISYSSLLKIERTNVTRRSILGSDGVTQSDCSLSALSACLMLS